MGHGAAGFEQNIQSTDHTCDGFFFGGEGGYLMNLATPAVPED